jgi:hypothetical protein
VNAVVPASVPVALDVPLPIGVPEIVAALDRLYRPPDRWLRWGELRVTTGVTSGYEQRIDYFAMSCWPSDRCERKCALLYSNRFYFVTPAGLLRPEEIPPECGLAEVEHQLHGPAIVTVVAAPWRDTPPPSWRFFASAVRRAREEAKR